MNNQLLGFASNANEALEYEFHCITCSDQAIPAKVMQIHEELGLALVELQGDTAEVDISLVDEVKLGDTILVHGGVALSNLRTQP